MCFKKRVGFALFSKEKAKKIFLQPIKVDEIQLENPALNQIF